MSLDRVFDVASQIVVVALVTTVLMRGSDAAKVISALGDAFGGSIASAQGRR